jgi:MoCo/4Fe-4S cofactor protein with predicted Tat translocation signal
MSDSEQTRVRQQADSGTEVAKPLAHARGCVDLAEVRAKLRGARGQEYWKSLEEVAATPEFEEMLHREFPVGASEWDSSLSRRDFFRLAAASVALAGATACTKQPVHEILPYVKQPEEIVLGKPLYYATTMVMNGYGLGVVAKSREGHPIKIDGNAEHPAVLGGSDIWMQASILDLYDPDRSQSVTQLGEITDWSLFISALNDIVVEHQADQGAGLRFLSEPITSPTLSGQIDELLKRFPKARLHQYDPIGRDNAWQGAKLAFGEIVEPHYDFEKAKVILSLESDFLYTHPDRLRYTRQYTNARRVATGQRDMNRLYVIESTPTVTGSMAEHRLRLESSRIEQIAEEIARAIGGKQSGGGEHEKWLAGLTSDLKANRGKCIVVAGESQPPQVHAMAHWLNEQLGNVGKTVFYAKPAVAQPVSGIQSLTELVRELRDDHVKTLFILGGNPVYNAPADFQFGELLKKTKQTIHIGFDYDETAAVCTWHVPQKHYLESWGDARSFDGTISLQQPLIAPLYGGKSIYEVLGAMTQQQPLRTDYEIVREHWRAKKQWNPFEEGWRKAVHDGFIADTHEARSAELRLSANGLPELNAPNRSSALRDELEVAFRPDPSIWDGRFANNAWLQECAKPISKIVWDNAVLVSPALAERNHFNTGDMVEVSTGDNKVQGPIWIMPGQADNTITLHLGYGRERIGRIGASVGFNVYPLRRSDSMWTRTGAKLTKLNTTHTLVTTQAHHRLHSPDREVYRQGTLAAFIENPDFVNNSVEPIHRDETLYNENEFEYKGHAWAMSIDLTTCIGCNACMLACNIENNIPVVGKEQVSKNREMYWIRIDSYFKGPIEDPEFNYMPVACMHCEHAPCELVCPVAATVHDHEGLNLQVYNRCVGTRFCSNNCPYKVRRFNFLRYSPYDVSWMEPRYNPEVTVRWRGVMEKCTYCVQRIASARITSEKENRPIKDGEVRTACQEACPAEAIIFGDLNDPNSKVAKLKKHKLDYSMLGLLNTRPRTTYLAKLQNPNPEMPQRTPVEETEYEEKTS